MNNDDFKVNNSGYGVPPEQNKIDASRGRPKNHPAIKREFASSIRLPDVTSDLLTGMQFIYNENCEFKTAGKVLSYLREMFLHMIDNGDYELLDLNPTDYSRIDFFYKKRICSNPSLGFEHNNPPYKVKSSSLAFSKADIEKLTAYRRAMGAKEGKTTPTILNVSSDCMEHSIFFAKMVEAYLYHVVMGLLPKEHEHERYTQKHNYFDPSFDLEAKLQEIRTFSALATIERS